MNPGSDVLVWSVWWVSLAVIVMDSPQGPRLRRNDSCWQRTRSVSLLGVMQHVDGGESVGGGAASNEDGVGERARGIVTALN